MKLFGKTLFKFIGALLGYAVPIILGLIVMMWLVSYLNQGV